MSFRSTTLAVILAAAGAPAAFANSGATWVGGEAGFVEHAPTGQRTRAEVQRELQEFLKSPVTSDGYDFVGGEIGYMPHQHKYVWNSGRKEHADSYSGAMGNSAAPAVQSAASPMTDAERRAIREQYIN